MEPVNNYQNNLAHSSASPVNSSVADPIQMAYKRKLGILTHSICQMIVLKFLNGEMALTLTCKHFTSNREEMSSLFQYEKLCASGTPPQHDPFRPLIQAAIPGRLMQQSLWQRLWMAREAGNEPWKRTSYFRNLSRGEYGLRDIYDDRPAPDLEKFYEECSTPDSPIVFWPGRPMWPGRCLWPGRRFEFHLIDNGRGYEDTILSIVENGRKISKIRIEPYSPLGVSSKDGIIGLVSGTDIFYVWKPDLDSLRK